MRNSVFILYQNIDSGAKVVTEEVVACLRQANPNQPLIVYQQNPHQFSGFVSALKNFTWSLWDCIERINHSPKSVKVFYTPYYLAVVAYLLSNKRHIPIIFHFHGDHAITKIDYQQNFFWPIKYGYIWLFGKLIEKLQTTALEKANQVIFVATQAQEDMTKKYNLKLDNQKVKIVPNGVATQVYKPATTKGIQSNQRRKKELGFATHQTIVLYSGRIDRKKGIHHILEALTQSQLKKLRKFGVIIMHPSYRDKDSALYYEQLQTMIAKHHLPVKLIAQPTKLSIYYQLADICLLPSEQEMMPLVMLEALACGTPFFGTSVGNMPEILHQIDPHLILKNNSAKVISEKLLWWSRLQPKAKIKLQQQSAHIAKRYSWKTTARSIQQAINWQVASDSN